MPTSLQRYAITETPDVKAWLDGAAKAWPDQAGNRSALIKRLLEAGYRSAATDIDQAVQRRCRLIEAASGSMPGVWPANWYQRYKQDEWS